MSNMLSTRDRARMSCTEQGGYIAIMSSIIIGMFLISCVATGSVSGWHARFNVLGSEAKEQSRFLARGCADMALTSMVADRSYVGDATTSESISNTTVECYIYPIATSSLPGNNTEVTIRARARVRSEYTTIVFSAELHHIVANGPLEYSQHDSRAPGISTDRWIEVPN